MTTKNAATLLADVLESYTVPPNQSTEKHRGFNGPEDLDAWRRHTDAAELVRTVDFTLAGMELVGEDTAMFIDSLPRWYAGIHFATTTWGSGVSAPRRACEVADVNLLRALGRLIDATSSFQITEEERRTLSDVLDEAIALLDADSSGLADDIRRYVYALIQRARLVIDNVDTYGPEAVRQVALELSGALSVQADRVEGQGDEPAGKRWRTAAKMLAIGFGGAAAKGGASELGSEVLKQITHHH